MTLKLVETPSVEERVCFDDFWSLYPRHEAKKAAESAWSRIEPDRLRDVVLGLYAWRPILMTRDPQYVPLPATWLNGERWEDEIPEAIKKVDVPRGTCTIPDSEKRSRWVIPQHVRDEIKRLMNK